LSVFIAKPIPEPEGRNDKSMLHPPTSPLGVDWVAAAAGMLESASDALPIAIRSDVLVIHLFVISVASFVRVPRTIV
jgi:hypothetical protein